MPYSIEWVCAGIETDPSQYVVCIRNDDVLASLELRKIYPVLPDPQSEESGMLRVIDESGEDYLYPRNWFVPINATNELRSALEAVTA
jgi:hypothetical protein